MSKLALTNYPHFCVSKNLICEVACNQAMVICVLWVHAHTHNALSLSFFFFILLTYLTKIFNLLRGNLWQLDKPWVVIGFMIVNLVIQTHWKWPGHYIINTQLMFISKKYTFFKTTNRSIWLFIPPKTHSTGITFLLAFSRTEHIWKTNIYCDSRQKVHLMKYMNE